MLRLWGVHGSPLSGAGCQPPGSSCRWSSVEKAPPRWSASLLPRGGDLASRAPGAPDEGGLVLQRRRPRVPAGSPGESLGRSAPPWPQAPRAGSGGGGGVWALPPPAPLLPPAGGARPPPRHRPRRRRELAGTRLGGQARPLSSPPRPGPDGERAGCPGEATPVPGRQPLLHRFPAWPWGVQA